MKAKASLHADPAASVAKLDAINGPVRQRRLMNAIILAADSLAIKHGPPAAECMQAAANTVLQAEANAAIHAARKRAGGKTCRSNGASEVARRLHQMAKLDPFAVAV